MSALPSGLPATQPQPAFQKVNEDLKEEIKAFHADCLKRYRFNNGWDVVLTTFGILLSIAIVACGFLKEPEVSAILGALVGATVTAQKAFPFGQRARFYRLLIGQAENLVTHAEQEIWNRQQVVSMLSTLRMDFAQELPRGTSAGQDAAGETKVPKKKGPGTDGSASAGDEDAPAEASLPAEAAGPVEG